MLVVVTDDKVGVIGTRLIGGVERVEEVSSSENSVKVDILLEEPTTDGAEFLKILERRLPTLDPVKFDTDG